MEVKDNILLSIIIPAYNAEKFIDRCSKSIINEITDNTEIIIIDDESTDNTYEICKEYESEYSNIRVIHKTNEGVSVARNVGIENAKGKYILFLDSDDWLEPTAIEHLFNLYYQTGADIVSGNALRHTDLGEFLLKEPRYKSSMEMVHNTIEMTLDHVVWRRLIKRSLYIDNHISAVEGIDVGEDHHTLPRLAYYATKVATLDEVVYHYNCMNPNSYMSIKTDKVNLKRFKSDLRTH